MKRILLVLVATILALVGPAQAQQLAVGARGGLTLTNSKLESALVTGDAGSKLGYHFGGVLAVDVSPWFGLRTELLYTRKGLEVDESGVDLKLTYIEVPVLTVIRMPTRLAPHILAGVVLSLESGCKFSSDAIAEVDCEAGDAGVPRTTGADFGVAFGGGVEIPFGRGWVMLDGLYNFGLTNISQGEVLVDELKNRSFYLSAGYLYPIGGRGP